MKLRAIEQRDLDLMLKWRNSEAVMPYCREYRCLSKKDQARWYVEYLKQQYNSEWDTHLMMIEHERTPIGIGGFTRIEWRNRKAELTFYIAEDCTDSTTTDALDMICRRGFDMWNFNKIYFPVYDHNPTLTLYETYFNLEAVLREEYFWDGEYRSRHYLTKYRKQLTK